MIPKKFKVSCSYFIILLLIVAISISMAGCLTNAASSDDQPTTPPSTIPVETEEPGYSDTPTIIPQTEYAKATSMSDLNMLPIREELRECLSIQGELQQGFLAEGVVIIGDFTEKAGVGELMMLTSKDDQLLPLLGAPTFGGMEGTSLDSKWLVYDHADDEIEGDLVVLSSDGQVHSLIDWEDAWGIVKWLDHERLVIIHLDESPISSDILNPFTGHRQILSLSLPSPWIPPDWVPGRWKVVYDPTLTRVVYMREVGLTKSFVLWDLPNNEELWRLDKYSTSIFSPVWSPDGTQLAIAALNEKQDDWDRFELFISDRDGLATQWIDLKGSYIDSLIKEVKWSPDGRYIAIAPIPEKPFLILDTVAQQLLDFCITANAQYDRIHWSPDSTQVIVPRWGHPSIVVDIKNKAAAQIVIDDDFRPVGWLTAVP